MNENMSLQNFYDDYEELILIIINLRAKGSTYLATESTRELNERGKNILENI